jgi:hypothetical protein
MKRRSFFTSEETGAQKKFQVCITELAIYLARRHIVELRLNSLRYGEDTKEEETK